MRTISFSMSSRRVGKIRNVYRRALKATVDLQAVQLFQEGENSSIHSDKGHGSTMRKFQTVKIRILIGFRNEEENGNLEQAKGGTKM